MIKECRQYIDPCGYQGTDFGALVADCALWYSQFID